MGDRIKSIRLSLGYTQQQFADKLGLSRNFIAVIETTDRKPSDRTIMDICREFHVSEAWLRYGEGEMLIRGNRNEEIQSVISDILCDADESFRKRLVASLCSLSLSEWQVLEKLSDQIAKNPDGP